MRIVFRTSGGRAPKKQLGFGHVYRCMNLAKKLNSNEIFFLIEDFGKQVSKILKENGFTDIHFLKNGLNLKSDSKITTEFIKKKQIDIVIIDKYETKQKYIDEIQKFSKVIVITDLKNINYSADLIVNGFIGFKNQKTKNKNGSKCLLGPHYQILNEKFSVKPKRIKKEFVLLATFGGFDENNIVKILLKSILNYSKNIKVKIILGPATKRTKIIRNLERKTKSQVTIINKTKNMYDEILNSNYGLCSGGITTYEFARLGIPFGIISQVNHQIITAKEWESKKLGINLGIINNNTERKIKLFLDDVNNDRFTIKRKLYVDGKGTERVASEIFRLIN